jgi:predicted MFS family arabinose efflux permease
MIRNVKVLTASSYVSMLFLGLSTTLVGAAAKNIGLSPYQIGLLVAAQNLGFMLSVFLCGALADSYRKPRILLVGSCILTAALLAFYLSERFWLYLMAMMFTGVGMGAYEGVTDAMLLEIHRKRESMHVLINHLFVSIGSVTITIYMIFLQGNWRYALIESAFVVGLLAVFFAMTQLDSRAKQGDSYRERVRLLARQPVVIILFACIILAVGAEYAVTSFLTTFLMDLRGFDQVTSKVGLVIFLSGMITGRLLVGLIADNHQVPRTMMALFGVACVIFSLLFLVDLGVLVYLLAYLAGVSLSATLPLMITLAGLKFKEIAGTVMGIVKLAIPIGGTLTPALMSQISGAVSFRTSLLIVPLSFLIGFGLMFAGRRRLQL